jgi:hypothetical protein
MTMNYDYAADQLFDIAERLKQYESAELRLSASMLICIAAEVRKLAPSSTLTERLERLKPTPGKSDPNSKIPRPTPPPRGSGPARLKGNGQDYQRAMEYADPTNATNVQT